MSARACRLTVALIGLLTVVVPSSSVEACCRDGRAGGEAEAQSIGAWVQGWNGGNVGRPARTSSRSRWDHAANLSPQEIVTVGASG
jgi:hypothetical protein